MKKIFTGIIIIVSSFLFYDIYNKYQTTHEDNLYGIDSINNKFNNIVTFEQTNYENNKDFINDLSTLADKYKVTVVKSDFDEKREIYQYYIYSHENIHDLCDIIVDKDIDFGDLKQKKYYSNLDKNKNAISLFSMGKNIFLNIKPISYLYNNHDVVGDYYLIKIIYVFLTIFLYLLKCPQSLILSALRAFCFCGKPHISRSIFLYFRYQAWLKSW
jgi:hypothetical protein